MIPTSSSSFRRLDSRLGDILGTPRRKSLNRVDPAMNSRSKTMVHRVHSTSAAMARGQNCLYPVWSIARSFALGQPSILLRADQS